MVYLFHVQVFNAASQSAKKPAWLWKQVDGTGASNFTTTVVFESREQMFTALKNTGLISQIQLAEADKALQAGALSTLQVDVPFGKENAVVPNLAPEPGLVKPSPEFASRVESLAKNKKG